MARQRPTVRRSAVVPAPRERVWSALTDSGELSRWFGADVELDPLPGGSGRFIDGGGTRHARVTGVHWGSRLDLIWWPAGGDPQQDASEVSFQVEDDPLGTRVVVTETAPASADTVQACFQAAAGWTSRTDRLAGHLVAVRV